MAATVTDPPASTVAERISATVAVVNAAVTDAPEPAADTPTPPPEVAAMLIATPKARASISGFDSARSDTSPPTKTVADSTAVRTELVTVIVFLAAPTVTPTAAPSPRTTPRPAPPAFESTADVSVAVTITALSVVTVAEPEMIATVSIARRFELPAPAPASPTVRPLPFATCPVPAIVHDVIDGRVVAVTTASPPSSQTIEPSILASTRARDESVPISLTATDTPAATDTVRFEPWAASAPATATISPASSAVTVRDRAMTCALPATVALTPRTIVFSENDPAPTNATGRLPSTPPSEPVERAPLTPTAQALIVPPVLASTLTSPSVLVTAA